MAIETERDPLDPKGLIREAYRIDGITWGECRSIFLDWALGLKEGDPADLLPALLDHYGALYPDHPMTAVLREGLEASIRPRKRRGGASRYRAGQGRG